MPPALLYGAAYHLEQWPRERWDVDARLMQEAGFNVARVGEFAWCRLEPRDGTFDLDWLADAIHLLGRRGIRTILCTPTAAPPVWLTKEHPDVRFVDNNGLPRPEGGRRNTCPNSGTYRRYSARVVEALARRFGADPDVVAWQIDNELAQEAPACRCDSCRVAFRAWLHDRFKNDVDALNRAVGAPFWGIAYTSFDEVEPPVREDRGEAVNLRPMFFDNPSLRLLYKRFTSDSNIAFYRLQADILRRHTRAPVTTNSTSWWANQIDYYALYRDADVFGVDVYPAMLEDSIGDALACWAHARNAKPGGPRFWVLETDPGGGGHGVWGLAGAPRPPPGAASLNTMSAYAAGAGAVVYFPWRTFPSGAEQLESAVIDVQGTPTRQYEEAKALGRDLARLGPILARSRAKAEIAILFDYPSLWSLEIKPVHRDFNYVGFVNRLHTAAVRTGWGVDVVGPDADFSTYRMVILPSPFVLERPFAEKLKAYVREGGILVSTFLTAVKDGSNRAYTDVPLPANLTDLFGCEVIEYELNDGRFNFDGEVLEGDNSWRFTTDIWLDALKPTTANTIATLTSSFRAGQAAVTANAYGKGTAWYIGTQGKGDFLDRILDRIVGRGAVPFGPRPRPFELPRGAGLLRLEADGKPLYYLFNPTRNTLIVKPTPNPHLLEPRPEAGDLVDVLTGKPAGADIELAPKAYRFIKEK